MSHKFRKQYYLSPYMLYELKPVRTNKQMKNPRTTTTKKPKSLSEPYLLMCKIINVTIFINLVNVYPNLTFIISYLSPSMIIPSGDFQFSGSRTYTLYFFF